MADVLCQDHCFALRPVPTLPSLAGLNAIQMEGGGPSYRVSYLRLFAISGDLPAGGAPSVSPSILGAAILFEYGFLLVRWLVLGFGDYRHEGGAVSTRYPCFGAARLFPDRSRTVSEFRRFFAEKGWPDLFQANPDGQPTVRAFPGSPRGGRCGGRYAVGHCSHIRVEAAHSSMSYSFFRPRHGPLSPPLPRAIRCVRT